MAPEKLWRGGAGCRADKADLVPAGKSLALWVNYHRRGLYNWSQTEQNADDESAICHFKCLMMRATVPLPGIDV